MIFEFHDYVIVSWHVPPLTHVTDTLPDALQILLPQGHHTISAADGKQVPSKAP